MRILLVGVGTVGEAIARMCAERNWCETLVLAVSGFVASLAFALAARWWITSVMPQFTIVYTIGNVMRAGLVAVVMAVLAAILPARRLNRLDPAVAYRSD